MITITDKKVVVHAVACAQRDQFIGPFWLRGEHHVAVFHGPVHLWPLFAHHARTLDVPGTMPDDRPKHAPEMKGAVGVFIHKTGVLTVLLDGAIFFLNSSSLPLDLVSDADWHEECMEFDRPPLIQGRTK